MKKLVLNGVHDGLRILRIVVLVAIPVGLLLFHVWTRYQITDLGYEVAAETRTHRQLIEEQRKLSIEATLQGRSDRVLAVARERFGLEELKPAQIIEVDATHQQAAAARDEGLARHAALEVNQR